MKTSELPPNLEVKHEHIWDFVILRREFQYYDFLKCKQEGFIILLSSSYSRNFNLKMSNP
jgi:hypothetical protein